MNVCPDDNVLASSTRIRKVPVEEALGMVLPHDMTEIIPGKKKGPAFKKGHIVRPEDIPRLKSMGKNHVYVLELGRSDLHEDEAAMALARAVAGPGVVFDDNVTEGKVSLKAGIDGLLKVERHLLQRFNELGDVMLATRHSNVLVKAGDLVAAGRAIPLVISAAIVDKAVRIASQAGGLVSVKPLLIKKASIIVTGREVYEGLVKDAFGPAMEGKLKGLGVDILSLSVVTDDQLTIAKGIDQALDAGAELILCTGGMSVDPDDVTRAAIRRAGAMDVVYGSPVLPGAMFLVAYIGDVPVLGIPACGMYFKITVLDLVLPRILAGERIDRSDIAALGHGGLCCQCKVCHYPICPFGKG